MKSDRNRQFYKTMKYRRLVLPYFLLIGLAMIGSLFVIQLILDHLSPISNQDKSLIAPLIRRVRSIESENKTENSPNCIPAAIEQFPKTIFTNEQRLRGAIAIYIFATLYFFFALAVICDDYFVPSLELICKALRIKPDVAGATLMAAGSSAPELATAIIAVFLTKDDIGVGTVVGSAVYNISFVVGICGLFAGKSVLLSWWPMFRDCFFYVISIACLIFTIITGSVSWIESLVFLIVYALYIVTMFFNERLEAWFKNLPFICCSGPSKVIGEGSQLMSYQSANENATSYNVTKESLKTTNGVLDGSLMSLPPKSMENFEEEDPPSVLAIPAGVFKKFVWAVAIPLNIIFFLTVPDCRRKKWEKWFFVTFLSSCFWIGATSYMLVWMITIIGYTFGIADTVMGLTFLAAGVSVPDAFSSLIVVREGLGDMAVSNAVGSNVFDILLCLGLPWFLQTAIIEPGSKVEVVSKGLSYTAICLLSTVVFLFVSTHLNGWKLNKKLGVIMMVWYITFTVLAGLYEGNIFVQVNLPMCHSDY